MEKLNVDKRFLVVGVGGLGCYIVEGLIRLGVKGITVCDPDTFSKSNLNRQLYSTPKNIGKKKVEIAFERAKELEYEGEFVSIAEVFDPSFLDNVDIAIDALDNIESRLFLEDECSKRNIPLVHGAVGGSVYQVGVSMPGSNLLHNIYKGVKEPIDKETNVITVLSCAAMELSLAMKEPEEVFEIFEI